MTWWNWEYLWIALSIIVFCVALYTLNEIIKDLTLWLYNLWKKTKNKIKARKSGSQNFDSSLPKKNTGEPTNTTTID